MTKKIIASFVGLTMALTMFPGMTLGATVEELQAQITTLMAQITALNAQIAGLGGTTPATGIPTTCIGVTFTRNLSQGSDGSDVKCLQALLNTNPATQVALTGAGSPNNETNYFGPLTRTAVVKMQQLYAAEILTPLGLTAGTGFVGPSTRAKLDSILTTTVTPPECTTDADCEEGYECVAQKCVAEPLPDTCETDTDCPEGYRCTDEECEKIPAVDPTEGSLSVNVYAIPGDGTIVPWGAENTGVFAIELRAEDSAIKVNRVDVDLGHNTPWNFVNYVTLFDGTNAVKGMAVNSTNAKEITVGGNRYMRFSGLDITVPKDGTKVLTFKVNTDTYPRTQGTNITFAVTTDYIRGTDTIGLAQYATIVGTVARTFSIASAGDGANIKVKSNPNNPAEGIIITSANTTVEAEVLRFDVEVTKDAAKITQMIFAVSTSTATAGFANVTALRLYDGENVIGSQTPGANTTFTNLSINVAKDATKTFIVKALHSATTTVGDLRVTYAAASTTAQSASGETVTTDGSVTGNSQFFYGTAPGLVLTGQDLVVRTASTSYADGYIEFSLTAMGGDIYVESALASTTASSTASSTSNGTLVAVDSAESAGDGVFVVREGQTKKFRIDMTLNNTAGTPGFKYAMLYRLAWGISKTAAQASTGGGWTPADFLKNLKTVQRHMSN